MRATTILGVLVLLSGVVYGDDPAELAAIEGEVSLRSKANPDVVVKQFKQLVVYLAPLDGAPIAPPAAITIRQKGAKFEPEFVVIARGQTVSFVNDDDIVHNVFSGSPPKPFDLGLYKDADAVVKDVVFDEPGLVKIHCAIHETMNGTIYVAPSPYFATIDDGGAFAIKGVRPGRYRLSTWHRRFPVGALEVTLEPKSRRAVAIALGGESSVVR